MVTERSDSTGAPDRADFLALSQGGPMSQSCVSAGTKASSQSEFAPPHEGALLSSPWRPAPAGLRDEPIFLGF